MIVPILPRYVPDNPSEQNYSNRRARQGKQTLRGQPLVNHAVRLGDNCCAIAAMRAVTVHFADAMAVR